MWSLCAFQIIAGSFGVRLFIDLGSLSDFRTWWRRDFGTFRYIISRPI